MIKSIAFSILFLHFHTTNQNVIALPARGPHSSDPVGQRTCIHLMLRLVDCLADACDLHLARLAEAPSRAAPSEGCANEKAASAVCEPGSFGNSVIQWLRMEQQVIGGSDSVLGAVGSYGQTCTALQMDLLGPAFEAKHLSLISEIDCWKQATEWLRGQLLALRMRLLLGNVGGDKERDHLDKTGPLADSLAKLKQLNHHLAAVCSGELDKFDWLDGETFEPSNGDLVLFITETLAHLAGLFDEEENGNKESERKDVDSIEWQVVVSENNGQQNYLEPNRLEQIGLLQSGASGQCNRKQLVELRAIETIKRHYAELSEMIETFYLYFA